ncbi:MAG: hypothetical protein AAGF24_09625 [Cyanobacteria bacterium P01_H01_bin.121]
MSGIQAAQAQESDQASYNAYDFAGDAGLIAAIGGLALNFFNTRNKFTKLELERLREMREDIAEERNKLRARLEQELDELIQKNEELQTVVNGLQTKINILESENTQLKSRVNNIAFENRQLKIQLKLLQDTLKD